MRPHPPQKNTYLDRFFTARATAVPGATRIADNDFSPVIQRAKEIGPLTPTPTKKCMTGFHYTQILGMAGEIVDAVKAGHIKHFFLIGGCDGAEPGRNYYTDAAHSVPDDAIILTLGCGKFRIRDHEYGTVAGIPRLLDMGQCNDAYGAIQVALALSEAFECTINELPLTFMLSWFEQKAVAVLLTLLHLGVKGVQLGPNLPAFLSPNVLDILVRKFDLQPISNDGKAAVQAAMAAC